MKVKKTQDSSAKSDPKPPVKSASKPLKDIPLKEMAAGTVLLGRYMLMELIGQGGTSTIYRARDMVAVLESDDEQSHLAVKVVDFESDSDVADNQLMLHEALITRHLAHPNIIKVYDYHREGSVCFVTMELVVGESLLAYLQRTLQNKLSYRHVMLILRPTALALEAAHAQGVIHSDMKPSNILMTDLGDIKVIDFATARTTLEVRENNQQYNRDASFYGYTLAYASPETIADKPATPSDDVFSLACIIYETLSGKHPYDRKPSDSIDASKFKLKKPSEVGFWQWFVLKKALSLKGRKRFQSVRWFVRWFTFLRHFWMYLIIIVVMLIGSIVGTKTLSQYLTAERVQLEKNQKIAQQQEGLEKVIERIRSEEPLLRYQQLQALNGTPTLLRGGALGLLYEDVVVPVLNHVENELKYNKKDISTANIPNFSLLTQQIDHVTVYYPDSFKLLEIKRRLITERTQLIDSLTEQVRKEWIQLDFSPNMATRLNNVNAVLKQLDKNTTVVVPELSVMETYHDEIMTAIERYDYRAVNRLFLFSQRLENAQEFKDQWQSVDERAIHGSQLLINYLDQDIRLNQSYPPIAVEYYMQPVFDRVNKLLSKARTEKSIFSAKEELYKIADRFQISGDSVLYDQAYNKLKQVIEKRITSQKRNRRWRSVDRLTELLKEISIQHEKPLPEASVAEN
ncbi:Serine/threonine protein kinase [hydrothermal vent metagenome]|uniref:non-specific serine/threonine protein kinase n=1 Tax=hydrothermal vent metagenome TaxID=652676 RepID=A0A3B0WP02_9ZZZZ